MKPDSEPMKTLTQKLPDFAAAALACYYEGERDALDGKPLETCRFKAGEKITAYYTGWHAGHRRRMEQAEPAPTAEQVEKARPHFEALRQTIAGWGVHLPFWSVQYRVDDMAHLWKEDGIAACNPYLFWPPRDREAIINYGGYAKRCPECQAWAERTGAEVRDA